MGGIKHGIEYVAVLLDALPVGTIFQIMTDEYQASPGIVIPIRQPRLDFDDDIPRHWFGANPVITHNFNGYNLLFPEFERFFIRSVMFYRDKIQDETLIEQVKGFIGQESMHARAHEAYFKLLERQGYEIRQHLQCYERYASLIERMATPKLRIALTAAAEHYTATLASIILKTPGLLDDVDGRMKKFIIWHAAEEAEHSSVSYDVMQLAGVGYPMRIAAFLMVTMDSLLWVILGSFMFLRKDKISLFRSIQYKWRFRRRFPTIHKTFRRSLFAYFRRDFYPHNHPLIETAHAQLIAVGIDAKT